MTNTRLIASYLSTPAMADFQLNDARIQRVLLAGSLDEATKMGPLDKIRDWFNGGVKRSTIEALYRSVAHPPRDGAGPIDMLDRFNRLAMMADPDHQAKFWVEAGKNSDTSEWSYGLIVGGQAIFRSGVLIDSPSENYNEFQGVAAAHEIRRLAAVKSNDDYVQACIECMCDDEGGRKCLQQKLSDPEYGRVHFVGVEDHPTAPGLFIAKFTKGNIEFSDRAATNGEFRAQNLKTALEAGNYVNLEELCLSTRGTPDDMFLKYSVSAVKVALVANVGEHGMEELREFFKRQTVGKTNMAELLFRDAALSVDSALHLPLSALRV